MTWDDQGGGYPRSVDPVIADIARDRKAKSAPRRRGSPEEPEIGTKTLPLINTDDTDQEWSRKAEVYANLG